MLTEPRHSARNSMPKLGKKRYGYNKQGMQGYIKALRRKRALKRKPGTTEYGDQQIG